MPELIDQYARKIDYMRISITDRCNLRCRYCMPEQGIKHLPRSEILSYEEMLRLARIAVRCGIRKIRITGGEPLTRKGVIYFLEQLNLNNCFKDSALTTNGVLLAEYAEKLMKAGIKRVNISLDTLNREKYSYITRKDYLPRVLEGIKEAESAGLSPIKINCVALRGFNDEEILDFAKLSLEHPYQIRFIEFMPLGEDDFWSPDKIIKASEIINIIGKKFSIEPVYNPPAGNNGPARIFKVRGGMGEIGIISPLSNHFCNTCNRIRLTPDGRLRNCLFSKKEINIKKPIREKAQDNVLERMLRESIRQKPPGHKLQEYAYYKCKMSMWKIGG